MSLINKLRKFKDIQEHMECNISSDPDEKLVIRIDEGEEFWLKEYLHDGYNLISFGKEEAKNLVMFLEAWLEEEESNDRKVFTT